MGQNNSVQKCNFEDIQLISNGIETSNFMLINTLPITMQTCLIKNTTPVENEETKINSILNDRNSKCHIFIYGQNSNDATVIKKFQQLLGLGFTNVYIYSGGLFEWLCLQDIYGEDEFPTTSNEIDILKFKPSSFRKKNLLKDVD